MSRLTEKPTGHLGDFYDYLASFIDDPADEIEEIALRFLSNGIINKKRYITLQYRVPFPGYERESLENVGKRIGLKRERVRQLEMHAARKLIGSYRSPSGKRIRYIQDDDGDLVLREV